MEKVIRAAVVIIGNEILSGRTQDKNINYIAVKLTEKGIRLGEVRIIPDVEEKIIETIKLLKSEYDYVFTSGGIGPTHDDITTECIAKVFGVPVEISQEAYAILLKHYGEADLTEPRKKMAKIPQGARLIYNPVSAAPGFAIENVYVMAGVPSIMQAMLDNIIPVLQGGDLIYTKTLSTTLTESRIAEGLTEIQSRWKNVEIGSYPYFKLDGFGVSVVLRSTNQDDLKIASEEIESLFLRLNK